MKGIFFLVSSSKKIVKSPFPSVFHLWLKSWGTVQLNLHETDLLFRYLSHHLTWHCSSISKICTDLQEICSICSQNFVIVSVAKLIRNNNKNNFASKSCKFLANLQKSWNNMMSNVGLIIHRIYGSVSYSFSCDFAHFLKMDPRWKYLARLSYLYYLEAVNSETHIIIQYTTRSSITKLGSFEHSDQ